MFSMKYYGTSASTQQELSAEVGRLHMENEAMRSRLWLLDYLQELPAVFTSEFAWIKDGSYTLDEKIREAQAMKELSARKHEI